MMGSTSSIRKLLLIYTVIITKTGFCQRNMFRTFNQLIKETSMLKTYSPNSLWTKWSMLKSMVTIHEKRDITKFNELQAFLKRKSKSYKPKKSAVLSPKDVIRFLKNAPNDIHLLHKSRMGNFVIKYPERADSSVRTQINFPKSLPFPCANVTKPGIGRSLERPTSVHRLRPGDIDVIGALGDSLVAGNGAMEEFALGTMIEYRGVSWCAGGQGTWREFLTLPNILKEFNPNLTGYSTGTGEFLSSHSKLNVAFPVAADADALRQAKILVKKMKTNPEIDVKRDWKMITIFFGANDICSGQCFDQEAASSFNHVRKLARALDYLEKNLPRTLINLIPVLDVSVSLRIKRTIMCRFLHRLFCECFHRGGNEMDVITSLTKAYQTAEEELIASGRYDRREDFTVVLQPFMKLFNAPDDPVHRFDEVIDISFITHDCFHFSQKGHALAANLLWNNLVEPVGRKSTKKLKYILETFECPKPNSPYLFTNRNSKTFLEIGYQ